MRGSGALAAVEMNSAMRLRAIRAGLSVGWAPMKTYAITGPRLHKSRNPASLPLFSYAYLAPAGASAGAGSLLVRIPGSA
jgi:hypothetical protein